MVICLKYKHFEKKLRSVIVSQNPYLNKIFDVHPLAKGPRGTKTTVLICRRPKRTKQQCLIAEGPSGTK